MKINRRTFLGTGTAAALGAALGRSSEIAHARQPVPERIPADRFDPWIEIDRNALIHNVAEVRRLSGGRPILAVIKNNAYGLGLTLAARLLEPMPEISAFAVVKTDAALELRRAGIRKPVHLMSRFPASAAADLATNNIQPCFFDEDAFAIANKMSRKLGGPVPAQVYLDTGMSRMGIPFHKAMPWIRQLDATGNVAIRGAFMGFTEDPEYDRVQLQRFLTVAEEAAAAGMPLGTLHAASSSGVFELPEAHLDQVRPGMALYGGYPNDPKLQRRKATLLCAVRLRARVVRVEKLRAGDSVSYGRNYVATKPTWVATIPAGHTDGYPRRAVEGARALIGERTYPVIGAVSASHTIVEIGEEKSVQAGDVATLMGSDAAETDPNWISEKTGASVYDLFMHLNPSLPRIPV